MTRAKVHLLILLAAASLMVPLAQSPDRQWLAGDSHIHSHWSPGYDRTKTPPEPIKGDDAIYAIPMNAQMAHRFGLSWMVTTDHGGPNHAKFNMTGAYEELKQSRKLVPDVLQYYGMELNMPAMDHHTLIVPHSEDEWSVLFEIEHRFDSNEAWPDDPARDTEAAAINALTYMTALPRLPLMFANHPSRSATGIGRYGRTEPREFRNNNDLAPAVYHGMEGAPGHQAGTLSPDGTPKRRPDGTPTGSRGSYGNAEARTIGGFDQMTAIVGGLWDSLLGEGRRFWIVATSDSHVHYTGSPRSGSDFWPGEYQKTYVYARKTYDDVIEGLRSGRIFAVAGDLITTLDVTVTATGRSAEAGGTLRAAPGDAVSVTIRFRDPETMNVKGSNPKVNRVDLIAGDVRGPVTDRTADKNDTTRVVARFSSNQWTKNGDVYSVTTTLPPASRNSYLRVRGTSTTEAEPSMDSPGEDPWTDLWFYSNPIFIEVQ